MPLQVHLLFHPSSKSARELALHLYGLLNGPSTDLGPRIPVRFGESGDGGGLMTLSALNCERALVVVLVDARMARGATAADRATADDWARLIEDLLLRYPPGKPGTCSVLPVALDGAAFSLSERLDGRSFVRLDAKDRRHLEFHVVVGCLRLLHGQPASEGANRDALPSSDVEVFLSHAKRDLPRDAWRGAIAAPAHTTAGTSSPSSTRSCRWLPGDQGTAPARGGGPPHPGHRLTAGALPEDRQRCIDAGLTITSRSP